MGRKLGSARHRGHPHRSPPRFRTTFLAAAAVHAAFASSLAQRAQAQTNGTLQISSSFEAFQCQNMTIAWSGGVPAYSLTVVTSNHVEEFAGIAGTSFAWLVDAPLATSAFVSLFDSTGARTDSPVFSVISGPGSSDTCLSPVSSSMSVPPSSASSSPPVSLGPTTSVRETPTVLSFGAAESHLPPGALAAIVAEAAVLTLSVVGLLIIFFLDHKDRTREQSPSRASPPVDLLESPRPQSLNPYHPNDPESRSTTAGSPSASPQPAAKELPLRTGTVRRGPSPTIQSAAARQSFAPSEATFVGLSASPAASIRGSPSSSVRFALAPGPVAQADAELKPRKMRRTPLWQESSTPAPVQAQALAPPSAFPAERIQSADHSADLSYPRDRDTQLLGTEPGRSGFDASTGEGEGDGGEPRLLMGRFEA